MTYAKRSSQKTFAKVALGVFLASFFMGATHKDMAPKELARLIKIISVERKALEKFFREKEYQAIDHLGIPFEKIMELREKMQLSKETNRDEFTDDDKKIIANIQNQVESLHYNFYSRTEDIILFQIEESLKSIENAQDLTEFFAALKPLAIHRMENIGLDVKRFPADVATDFVTRESAIYNAALYIGVQAGKKVEYALAKMYDFPLVSNPMVWLAGPVAGVMVSIFAASTVAAAAHDVVKATLVSLSNDEKLFLEAMQGLSDFTIRTKDLVEIQTKTGVAQPIKDLIIKQFDNSIVKLIGENPKIKRTGIFKREDKLVPGTGDKTSLLAQIDSKYYAFSKAKSKDMFNRAALLLYKTKEKFQSLTTKANLTAE